MAISESLAAPWPRAGDKIAGRREPERTQEFSIRVTIPVKPTGTPRLPSAGVGKWREESLENLNQSVEWDADVVGSAITALEIPLGVAKG